VQNYIDIGNAKAFFARMGIEVTANVRLANTPVYVDFTTGEKLTNYTPPPTADRTEALKRYLAEAEKYLPVLEPGWWNFPKADEIPAELLLPFGDFAARHNLTAGLPQMFFTTGFGIGDMLDVLTLWFMRGFGVDMCRTLLGINSGFVPASRNNQDLYDAILKRMGSDVLLSTTVVSSQRAEDGVILQVRNSISGERTRIVAKRLLFTAPPTDANLRPFDLNLSERGIIRDFEYGTSFVGVVSHPSLPLTTSLVNTPSAAQPANWPASLPVAPYSTRFDNYANSSYYRVVAVGDASLTEDQARKLVTDSFDNMVKAGTLQQTDPPQPLRFHLFKSHGPVGAHVSLDLLKAGFLQRINRLQGYRATWYNGAAWSTHLTTNLWIFTDGLLAKLVEGLK
jgi:hypothetical protein